MVVDWGTCETGGNTRRRHTAASCIHTTAFGSTPETPDDTWSDFFPMVSPPYKHQPQAYGYAAPSVNKTLTFKRPICNQPALVLL